MLSSRKVLLLVGASFLFAGSFVAGKYTTEDLGPLTTSCLRYIVTLLFLSSFLVPTNGQALKIRRSDWLLFVLLGSFGIVGYHYFFFSSLRYTAVANTAIINALNPILTGMTAALFLHERLLLRNYVGVGIAFVGVLILLTNGDITNLFQLQFNGGDLLMVLAVMSWVIYSLMIKKLSRDYSGFTITYYAALFGVIQLLLLAIPEGLFTQIQSISVASMWSILYMGIGASGLGYLLYNLSVKDIGPTKTSSFTYSFVPIFVAILAFLFFRETLTVTMVASMGLIILGLNFTLREQPRQRKMRET